MEWLDEQLSHHRLEISKLQDKIDYHFDQMERIISDYHLMRGLRISFATPTAEMVDEFTEAEISEAQGVPEDEMKKKAVQAILDSLNLSDDPI